MSSGSGLQKSLRLSEDRLSVERAKACPLRSTLRISERILDIVLDRELESAPYPLQRRFLNNLAIQLKANGVKFSADKTTGTLSIHLSREDSING